MDLDKAIRNNLVYYKRVHEEIKARKTRSSLIHLRKKWLDKQNIANYQSEFDRIRSIMANTKTGDLTKQALEKRSADLKALGAKMIDGIV